jgi:hypothetical protein
MANVLNEGKKQTDDLSVTACGNETKFDQGG